MITFFYNRKIKALRKRGNINLISMQKENIPKHIIHKTLLHEVCKKYWESIMNKDKDLYAIERLQTKTILDISARYLRGLKICLLFENDITECEMKELHKLFCI